MRGFGNSVRRGTLLTMLPEGESGLAQPCLSQVQPKRPDMTPHQIKHVWPFGRDDDGRPGFRVADRQADAAQFLGVEGYFSGAVAGLRNRHADLLENLTRHRG